MARKAKNTNKKCNVCGVVHTPKATKCPKCGHPFTPFPGVIKFEGMRKPLTSGGKLKLRKPQ
jgi:hypothetical protein